MLAVLGAPATVARSQTTSVQFDVALGGVKIGVFWMDGSVNPRAYTASAGFESTGLIGQIATVKFQMLARGRLRDGRFAPDRYSEDAVVGRRSSSAVLTYENGVPSLEGGKLGMEEADPAVAAQQQGTLDPLTALFVMMRDQPAEGICQIDQFVFDGARRTRTVMNDLSRDGADILCRGQFHRLEGYSQKDLQRGRVVDLVLRYLPQGDGMTVSAAEFSSPRGTVRLTRRWTR
ncbi:MAG: DUF3108 domain-containing protein [Aestuariivita sp.]|uniref:DUF3108 domain-containing protein n=1 Tax=Aestuariivita sp. TaxID=1872407 RepID=UPI003BAF090C